MSIAVLTLMERLSPKERVVYVLREAFGYPHSEIAQILDISEANSQQIHRRARQHVAEGRARRTVDAAAARRIVEEFLAATLSGDTAPLLKLLADGAVSIADGGGKVHARTPPLVGALAIARFLRSVFRPTPARRALVHSLVGGSVQMHVAEVNGGPAVLFTTGGQVVGVLSPEVTADGITALHIQANPDKLERISQQWAAAERTEPYATVW